METVVSLDQLKPGERAVLKFFGKQSEESFYLRELGLLEGTIVQMIKFAPLGDPLEIRFRGYHLSIRRSVANSIMVEKLVEDERDN